MWIASGGMLFVRLSASVAPSKASAVSTAGDRMRLHVGNLEGSALHVMLFCRKPHTSVIDFQWVAKPLLPASIT